MRFQAEVDLRGDQPAALHGGPMLGVGLRRKQSSAKPATMRFYTWRSRQPCGSEFPNPHWLNWSPSFDLCVMAYNSYLLICRLEKQFSPIMSIPVAGALNGVWHGYQLYLVTPTSVESVIVLGSGQHRKKGKKSKGEQFLQVKTILGRE